MSTKVISFIIDDVEQSLDSVMAAAIDEIHSTGRTIREIRITSDAGEQKIPANTVAGVTVTEPVVSDTSTPSETPTTQPEPAPPTGDETPQVVVTPGPDVTTETPSDVPVDTPAENPVVTPATPPA